MIWISLKLKSLIAALHSSRQVNGKQVKDFDVYGVHFGWQVLKELWKREMNRARCGRMRRVPQLSYRHIFRDCWTRLNVKPAKIMQVISAVKTLKPLFPCAFFYDFPMRVLYINKTRSILTPQTEPNVYEKPWYTSWNELWTTFLCRKEIKTLNC